MTSACIPQCSVLGLNRTAQEPYRKLLVVVLAENVPKSEMGTIPDRLWLSFIQSRSRGALAASKERSLLFAGYELANHPDDIEVDARVFDPNANFLLYYSSKRRTIAKRTVLRIGGK